MQTFLEGRKTWLGIILIVLGWLGWGDLISSEQLGQVFDLTTQLIGIVMSVYGNYHSHKKIDSLEHKLGVYGSIVEV